MTWAYASAVQAGDGKVTPQDACAITEYADGSLLMAVSDGAGSAPLSDVGANFVVSEFCRIGASVATDVAAAKTVVQAISEGLGKLAIEAERPVGEYAATLVGAVVLPTSSVFVQVGDGIAVFRQSTEYEVALRPEEAEFVNSTYFVTDPDVSDHIQTRVIDGPIESVALLTDGLQALVLHADGEQPHVRFFETVFRNIRVHAGADPAASAWLSEMLCSELVTNRTDDDTSILAAKRT